jgi:hypothetical protein
MALSILAWIVSRDGCWTADRVERRGLPRPSACPLYDQKLETIQHLLLECVVAQEIWAWALHRWDRLAWLLAADVGLLRWWTSLPCPKATQRDLWTTTILCIWRHRNGAVFNNARPDVVVIETRIREEHNRWRLARIFCSDSFDFLELVPWIGRE